MSSLMSIVIPCYNEEDALPLLIEAITPVRKALLSGSFVNTAAGLDCSIAASSSGKLSFAPCETELILVDDGSKDRTLELMRHYNASDASVRYISFSRNFGKEAAIYAGLQAAKGDYVVLMDADLQHPVECIPEMYSVLSKRTSADDADSLDCSGTLGNCSASNCRAALGTGSASDYDSVAMYRTARSGEKPLRSFFSKCFFRLMNRMSKIDLVDGATDYRMMKRPMVDAVLEMHEYNRFTKGIFNWVGFSTKWCPYTSAERSAGTTKWSFKGLLRYALEGMFAFSTTPLTISFSLGAILCILAIIYAVFTIIKTLVWGDPVAGYPSLFTMILLLGGIQLLFLGIFGQYLSKMYLEVKHRPIYITKECSKE